MKPNPVITLGGEEQKVACFAAELRQSESERKGLNSHFKGSRDNQFLKHLLGAEGEVAFAKLIGVVYDVTVNTFHDKADVAGKEVRTREKDWHDLPLRSGDRPGRDFVLCCKVGQHAYCFKGWIKGEDGMKPKYWRQLGKDRPPLWVVPQKDLNPMSSLRIDD